MTNKRVHLVLALGVALLFGLLASPAFAGIAGSKHDLSTTGPNSNTNATRNCVFCHTPHMAAAANGQYPLWNHEISAVAAYGVYTSDTLDAVPTDIGGAAAGTASVSNLCMSCHDGTVAINTLYNDPNETPTWTITASTNVNATGFIINEPNLGSDLSDDHPINFTYDNALFLADGELIDPDSADWVDVAQTVPLFGATVQCASCHDPHDDTFEPFMVKDNTDSLLCTTCHVK